MNWLRRKLADDDQKNALFIIVEVIWSGAFAIVSSFMSIFAIRLGATNTEIGLLTSIPALLTILVSFSAARFLQRRQNPLRWTFGSLVLFRGSYLLLALL